MSKAFTKESDSGADDPADDLPEAEPLPPGARNYMTPGSFAALQAERDRLWKSERPKVVETVSWAAGNGDRSENGDYIYGKKRLREIDRRLRYLDRQLQSAVTVDPRQQQGLEQVFFGARVTYLREGGSEVTVQLVGVDEADMAQGKISFQSPVARALLKAREGDEVMLRSPGGVERLEILSVAYPLPDPVSP